MEEFNPSSPQIEDQPVTPPQDVKPPEIIKPKKNLKAPILAGVFFLLLATLGFFVFQNFQLKKSISQVTPPPTGGTQLSPTSDPTADWKEYVIEDVNITFKAPREFYVHINPRDPQSDGPTGAETIIYIQNHKFNDYPPENYYHLYALIGPVTLKTNIDELKSSLINVEDLKIFGQDAIQGISKQNQTYVTFFIKNDERFYLATSKLILQNKVITNQILSTFKFTN